jgi:hypothetical protein
MHQSCLGFKFIFTIAFSKETRLRKAVLEIFGDTAEPSGTTVPPLDKVFAQDVSRREHECLGKN